MAASKIPVDLILNKLAEDAQRVSERTRDASDVLLEPMDSTGTIITWPGKWICWD